MPSTDMLYNTSKDDLARMISFVFAGSCGTWTNGNQAPPVSTWKGTSQTYRLRLHARVYCLLADTSFCEALRRPLSHATHANQPTRNSSLSASACPWHCCKHKASTRGAHFTCTSDAAVASDSQSVQSASSRRRRLQMPTHTSTHIGVGCGRLVQGRIGRANAGLQCRLKLKGQVTTTSTLPAPNIELNVIGAGLVP